MIRIEKQDAGTLWIRSPDQAHKAQAVIFSVIGLGFTAGVLGDPEAPLAMAAVPFLVFCAGIAFFFVGGKPDTLRFDRTAGTVEVLIREGSFKKAEPRVFRLSEISGAKMEHSLMEGGGEIRAARTFGIYLVLADGTRVQATPEVNRRKQVEAVFAAVRDFLGR